MNEGYTPAVCCICGKPGQRKMDNGDWLCGLHWMRELDVERLENPPHVYTATEQAAIISKVQGGANLKDAIADTLNGPPTPRAQI